MVASSDNSYDSDGRENLAERSRETNVLPDLVANVRVSRISKTVYTAKFRDEAVKFALIDGIGVLETFWRLSIPVTVLANWVRKAAAGNLGSDRHQWNPLIELEAELVQVKRELVEFTADRDLINSPSRVVWRNRSRGQRYRKISGTLRRLRDIAGGLY